MVVGAPSSTGRAGLISKIERVYLIGVSVGKDADYGKKVQSGVDGEGVQPRGSSLLSFLPEKVQTKSS